jgi:class 3 adenylate cyclase
MIKNFNSFNEAKDFKTFTGWLKSNNPVRSERILNQAQREYEESPEVNGESSSSVIPAMVFTDVVGSSKQWSEDPIKMAEQLEQHHILIDSLAKKHRGWIVKTIGDAFMVYFEPSDKSLYNALNFAKEAIEKETKYSIRVGVCTGNMNNKTYTLQNVKLKDFFGNAVNTASRMESKVAAPDGIAFTSVKPISNIVLNDIQNKFGDLEVVKNLDLNGVKVKAAYKVPVESGAKQSTDNQ